MKPARITRAALLLALAAALAPGARADEVAADEPRVRVATLLPFVEDALRLAPERVAVVATVRRSLHEPVAPGIADLGNPHSPSFEALAQARPDVVVGDAAIHATLVPRIERLGMEVLLLETPSVEATFDELERVAARVGAEAEMARAVAEARVGLDARALETPRETLALFGTPGSFFAVTGRTWLGDLLARLNFHNVGATTRGDERFPGLVALSDEALATLRPELVVLVAHGDPRAIREAFERKLDSGGPWRSIRESSGGRVHVLDPALFTANPGLDLPHAAGELAKLAEGDGA